MACPTWWLKGPSCTLHLSRLDLQVYISVGEVSQRLLTPTAIDTIIEDMRPYLRAEDYGTALERAIVQIGLSLAGEEPVDIDDDDSAPFFDWEEWGPLLAIVAFVAAGAGFSLFKHRERTTVRKHLKRLQADLKVRLCNVIV